MEEGVIIGRHYSQAAANELDVPDDAPPSQKFSKLDCEIAVAMQDKVEKDPIICTARTVG